MAAWQFFVAKTGCVKKRGVKKLDAVAWKQLRVDSGAGGVKYLGTFLSNWRSPLWRWSAMTLIGTKMVLGGEIQAGLHLWNRVTVTSADKDVKKTPNCVTTPFTCFCSPPQHHLLEMLLLLSSLVTMMARTGFLGRRRRRLSASILRGHNPRILRHGLNSEPRGQNLEIPSIANAALPTYGTIVALKHCGSRIIRVSIYRKTSISKLALVGLNIWRWDPNLYVGHVFYIHVIWDVFVQYLFLSFCFFTVCIIYSMCLHMEPLTWEGGRSKSLLHILGRLESRDLNKRRNPYFHPYL